MYPNYPYFAVAITRTCGSGGGSYIGKCRLRIQYHTCLCCVNGLRNLAQKAEGHYL